MDHRLITGCALLAGCSFGGDWKPARPGEIFGYTVVGRSPPLDSIILGQPWETAVKYGAREGDTLSALPDGTFGGADAIDVHRDTNGRVTQLEFYYHASRDLNALVSGYRSSLGSPFAVTTDTVAGTIRTTTRWKNENTEFAISTLTPPQKDGIGAFAVLTDRSSPR